MLTVVSVIWNMGKGSLTFSRIKLTVDDYHILQTSASVGFDVLLRMSTSFLLANFCPLVLIEGFVTVFFHLFTGVVFCTACPTIVANRPVFRSYREELVFSKTLFSLSHHPFLIPSSTALETGTQPLTEGFVVDAFSACRLTCCCLCHPHISGAHWKYFRFCVLVPIKIHLLK